MAHAIWEKTAPNKARSRELAEKYAIPGFTAHLLTTRGLSDDESVPAMLGLEETAYSDPFSLKDMDKAVARIEQAIESFESIAIYGDYDVDGITSAALLCSYLEMSGANVCAMIPDREADGYGIRKAAVDRIHNIGATLIITVDNGISAIEEIDYANSLGIDVVVTDHHKPGAVLPAAKAVVDPHRQDDESSCTDLAGVGVVFKLLCALSGDVDLILENYADLIALGTVADIMPLRGENHSLVRVGLEALSARERPAVSALTLVTGTHEQVTARDISFGLAPRINAAGRMGSADRALRLMMSDDYDEAMDIANELNAENIRRHAVENEMLYRTAEMLEEDPSLLLDRVIVIDGDGWHRGIIGIFAAKMCEGYGKPCIIISSDGDIAHGSGRSLPGFSLHDALVACQELLMVFGGHEQAAGLTLETANIEQFRRAINEYAAKCDSMPVKKINIDCELSPRHLDLALVEAARLLEPFGEGNAVPVIGLYSCRIDEIVHLKNGNHQKLIVSKDGARAEILLFSVSNDLFPYQKGDCIDAAVKLDISEFKGRETLSLKAVAVKPSGVNREMTIKDERLFEKMMRSEPLTEENIARLTPTRPQIETVYRHLRSTGGFGGDTEVLLARLADKGVDTYAVLLTIIEVLKQTELIESTGSGAKTRLTVKEVSGKVDINDCAVMKLLTAAR